MCRMNFDWLRLSMWLAGELCLAIDLMKTEPKNQAHTPRNQEASMSEPKQSG